MGSGSTDPSWTITTSTIQGEGYTGPAYIVSTRPNGWATPTAGSNWIAPAADQTNATRPGNCCQGATVYQVTFKVSDPSTASVILTMAADDGFDAYLNPSQADINQQLQTGYPGASLFYSTTGPTYSSPVQISLKQGGNYTDPLGASHKIQFQQGQNTLTVVVDNGGGGPTGLYVYVAQPVASPSAYNDTSSADGSADALSDPVNSASGQFYDTEVDFRLGGPLQLGFFRYYSSQLSSSGKTSALGTNWMGAYDVSALVSGTNASVLLFGGRVVTFANSAGAWQLTSPKNIGYQFAAAGSGFQFMNPVERRIYTFDAKGVLTKIEDRNGNALTVAQGPNGPTQVSDGLGRSLAFTYSGTQLASVKDQSGRTVTYSYSNGLLSSVTDPLKNVTQYAYASAGSRTGLLVKETLPLGNAPVAQTYDANGRVVTQTNAANNAAKVAYDGSGGTTVTDPLGSVLRQKSDAAGNIAQVTDAMGGVMNFTYDGSSNRTSVTNKTGNLTRYLYHTATGYVAAVTDALGKTTTYSYTAQMQGPFTFYNLTGIAYRDGTSASLSYDASGNLISFTAADGSVKSFAYDRNGRLTQATDPMQGVTTYTWNSDGTLASKQDRAGNVTAYAYDSLKRLIKLTDPNGSVANYAYDSDGRRIAWNVPGGATVSQHFDANGQRDSWVGALGQAYRYTYDANGRVATATDPQKNVTTYSYDAAGRRAKVQNGAGDTVTYTYDAAGRKISEADKTGLRYTFKYDAQGRMTARTDGTGRTTAFGYDADGRLTSTTSPAGNTYAVTYDANGRIVGQTNPLGEQTAIARDAAGRVTAMTSPGGNTTTLQRDANGNVKSFTSPNGNAWSMSYDPANRITGITDPLGNATTFAYTGTLISQINYPAGSAAITRDAAGRPVSTAYSDGTTITNAYDANGLVTSATGIAMKRNAGGQITSVNGLDVTYDAAGRIATVSYGAGKVVTYAYDAAGRLASVTDWNGGKTAFGYDAASRPAKVTYPNSVATTYSYDADGRLGNITYGSLASIAMTRDGAGRITAADRNMPQAPVLRDGADQFSYNAAAQLTAATYDSMGRVTSQGSRNYTWNLASQLVGFSDPITQSSNTYDANGGLLTSTASGAPQSYTINYAMTFPALSVVQQGGADYRYYIYQPDGSLLYSIEAGDGTRHFFHFDEMGNTAFLTDDTGAVTDTYAITPYGEVADHSGVSDNPFTWQGRVGVMQQAQGLYYMRSRYYDAATARFLSIDPVTSADPRKSEPYAYALGNPEAYIDPNGQWDLFGAISSGFQSVVHAVQKIFSPPPPPPPPPADPPPPPDPPYIPPPVVDPGAPLIGSDAAGLIGSDAAGLIGSDAAGLIGSDAAGLIGSDAAGLIGSDAAGLIGSDAAGLIGSDAAGVISNDGGSVISNDGGSFTPRGPSFYKLATVDGTKPKNNKN